MVLDDVNRAILVSAGEEDEFFSKIYYSSNESLKDLFGSFSVKDKDVLTVLASSDQLFYAYDNGARKVDTFDVNCLTKYYYYLRRWTILYNKQYYPSKNIFHSHKDLYLLLDKVECHGKSEEDALYFWKNYLSKVTPIEHELLYFIDGSRNSMKSTKSLRERLMQEDFTFYNMNLFGDIDCSRKYDVIITSNILEYAWNSTLLRKCKDNLKSLLRDGGQIISSHFVFYPGTSNFLQELQIFDEDFEYSEFKSYQEPFGKKKYPLGYSYTKKKM